MKNLNVKPYQAYHPYNIPANHHPQPHHNQNQQQHNHLQQQQQQQHQQQQFSNNTHNLNSYTAPSSTSQRYTSSNSYASASVVAATTNSNSIVTEPPPSAPSLTSPHLQNNTTPPTLGGYLANQQHLQQQQQQQQQLRLQQSYNHQQQQHQQQQPLQQSQTNMLSLNQNNTYNYNFHFNALCGGNNQNNNNNSASNNNKSYHNNSALSRPQRPNSLNLNAMASLATPISGSAYSLPSASTTAAIAAGPTTAPSSLAAATSGSGFPFTPQTFYNQRENVFNFSATNAHNYLQQSFNNYNIQQQQQQHHQHQQQQQQQLQQFQLLQQQLKQQHHQQQQQQLQQMNTLGEQQLTPVSKSSSIAASPSTGSSGGGNSLTNTGAGAAAASSSNHNSSTANQSNNNNSNTNNNNSNSNNNNNCDRLAMDACEIANFLANELFMQQLVSMECMQTGVPTLTTPTLTPTTLRSIEESFIQLTSEPINAPYQAGFIPPPLASYNATTNNANATAITSTPTGLTAAALNNVYLGDLSAGASLHEYGNINDSETEENSQESWNDQNLHEENSLATTDNSSAATDTASFQNGLNGLGVSGLNNSNSSTTNDFTSVNLAALAVATAAAKMSKSANLNSNTSSSATTNHVPTRRGGGRRPATNANMTPEEEEKRRVRRERNKLAAARCRKRRVDQTNELTDEVTLLERKREELQKKIESLNGEKQDLEFILEAHRPTCQIAHDMLSVNSLGGMMSNTSDNDNITGLDTTLSSTARSNSPLDLKPVLNDQLLAQIKPEPLDSTLDSNSSLDGPPSPKKMLLSKNNPMIPPPLPNVATLSASLAAASASLNTPIVTTAPISFGSLFPTNTVLQTSLIKPHSKQRPNSLPTVPRNLAQNLALNMADNKPPTDINGVAIQTPSTGMFNFDSLMDGGTGLTPVSGPLVPTCSSQNKHPLELVTPTSEPSKLVSL